MSSVESKIKTSGQLREFLATMMLAVKNGTIEEGRPGKIIKLAQQVNESFYSEVKIQKVSLEADKALHDLGKLPLNLGA